jgi:hypothetical protein
MQESYELNKNEFSGIWTISFPLKSTSRSGTFALPALATDEWNMKLAAHGMKVNAHSCHHKLYKRRREIRSGESTAHKHDTMFSLSFVWKSTMMMMLCLPHLLIKLSILSPIHTWRITFGASGSLVVKALCYKPEGREFHTRWGDFFLNLPNPSGRTRPWGLLSL